MTPSLSQITASSVSATGWQRVAPESKEGLHRLPFRSCAKLAGGDPRMNRQLISQVVEAPWDFA